MLIVGQQFFSNQVKSLNMTHAIDKQMIIGLRCESDWDIMIMSFEITLLCDKGKAVIIKMQWDENYK